MNIYSKPAKKQKNQKIYEEKTTKKLKVKKKLKNPLSKRISRKTISLKSNIKFFIEKVSSQRQLAPLDNHTNHKNFFRAVENLFFKARKIERVSEKRDDKLNIKIPPNYKTLKLKF